MLIVCAGFGLFLINALDTPMLMILSGAPACFINEPNLLDTIFLLSPNSPLIKEGLLGCCAVHRGAGQGVGSSRGSPGEVCSWQVCVLPADVSCLLVWSRLIRCSPFHSALLRFKELKGPTESEKQTDPFFPNRQRKKSMQGYYVGLRPRVPKVSFLSM